jgi:hypothetical protein
MLRKAIRNILVIAAVLLVGATSTASCSSGGGGPSVSSVCSAYCNQMEECVSSYFDDLYDSKSECKSECMDNVNSSLDDIPTECRHEMLAYEECRARVSCNELENYDYSDCDDEYADFMDCLDSSSSDADADGDADSDADSDYDNVAACEEFQMVYNDLDCVTEYTDWYCADYSSAASDMTNYFYCLEDAYYCDELDYVAVDSDIMDECYSYLSN